ncbi:MAG: ATP-binding protein [Desulfomonilaceae bacterium]|nr:ATP-binding protein [Desulfomonilaceae bacterium]
MRWGILANLAVILAVSGFLLFLVFSASLERSAIDLGIKQATAVADLFESRLRSAQSSGALWNDVRALCRSQSGTRILVYGSSGDTLGGCGPDSVLGAPEQNKFGRRIRIERPRWPSWLSRPPVVMLDVTDEFPHGVRSFRAILQIPSKVFSPAWKFFGGYLILTQAALFFLGYILFHRTVIGPVQEVARLAGKASGLTEFQELTADIESKGDIQKISSGLRAMIVKIVEDRRKMEALVDQLRSANRDLQAAQQGLIRSEKLAGVGRLAAGLAHEIGNPLQIVMGYQELLQKSLDRKRMDDILPRMDQELRRIHEILRRLLDFAGPMKEAVLDCDINQLLKECGSLIDGRKGFRNITFEYGPDPDVPTVKTEPEKIRQVLVNLIFNAVDAIPDEGGTISLRTRRRDDGIEIEVEDTGVGIPETDMHRIFDPFFTTKEPGKGTGLGLAVCLGLIESLGGTITIRSVEGRGTAVTVRLPPP